jgi:hypothetical protein
MAKKMCLWLAVAAVLAVAVVAALAAPAPVQAGGRAATLTPSFTPTPISPAKVGSNAHLAIGAVVLVLIILFGIGLNFRRKK